MHTIVALDYKKDEQFIINDATYTKVNRVNGDSLVSFEIEYTQNNIEVFEKLDKRWYMRIVEDNHEQDYVVQTIYEKSFGNSIYLIVDALDARYDTLKREMVYKEHSGSKTRDAWFQWVMDGSSYKLDIRVGKQNAMRMESFGYDSRLSLLFQLLDKFGLEFYFTEQTIVIVDEIGDDKSDYISYGINLIESTRIREMSGFGTYGELFGAYLDEENKDKGRHHATYTHELAKVYGKLPIKPIVDERFTVKENMIAEIKKRVEASINISIEVNIDELNFFERGSDVYAGDKIMIIDPRVNMQGEIRIVESNVTRNHLGDYIDVTYTLGGYNEQYKSQTADTNMYNDILNHDKLIEDMGDKIGTVMEQAGGYGNIYRSKEEPMGPNLKHGDLWYQPYWNSKLGREETRMYQYEKEGAVGRWVLIGDSGLSDEIKEHVEELQKESDMHKSKIDEALREADDLLVLAEQARTNSDDAREKAKEAYDKAEASNKTADEARKEAFDSKLVADTAKQDSKEALLLGQGNHVKIEELEDTIKLTSSKVEANKVDIASIKIKNNKISSTVSSMQVDIANIESASDRNYIIGTSDAYKNVSFDGSVAPPDPPEDLIEVKISGYDENWKELYSYTEKHKKGSTQTFNARVLSGYDIVNSSKTETIREGLTINFNYKEKSVVIPPEKVSVTIKYVDENALLIDSKVEMHEVNTYVTFVAKDINGYELTSNRTQEIYINDNTVVKFNYKKKEETVVTNIVKNPERELTIRGSDSSPTERYLCDTVAPSDKLNLKSGDYVDVQFEMTQYNISGTDGKLQFAIRDGVELSYYININSIPKGSKFRGIFRVGGGSTEEIPSNEIVVRVRDFPARKIIKIRNLSIQKTSQTRMNLQLFSNSLSGLVKIGQIDIDERFSNEPNFLVSCYVDTDYDTGLEIILKNSWGSEIKRIKSKDSKRSGFIECEVPYVQNVKVVEVYLANRSTYSYNKGRYKWLQGELGKSRTPWKPAPEDLATQIEMSNVTQTVKGLQVTVQDKANQSEVTIMSNQLNSTIKRIDGTESQINQQADLISTTIKKLDETDGKVTENATQILQLDNAIQLTVKEVKTLGGNVSSHETQINLNKNSILLTNDKVQKLDKSTIANTSEIKLLNDKIALKVEQSDYDKLDNIVKNQQSEIVLMKDQINLKVSQSKFDTLNNKVGTHSSEITLLKNQVNLKVGKQEFDRLGNTVSNQESQIKLLRDNINLKVSKNEVVSSINVSPERIRINSKLIHLSGQTLIDDAIIKSSMILSLTASKINTGTLNASLVNVINLNANNISSGYISSDRILARSIRADHLESDAITVGFNNNSTNIKLYGNRIEFSNGDTLKGRITSEGQEFWYGRRKIGHMGETSKTGSPNIRGIGNRLEYEGDFISWSYQNSASDTNFTSMLVLDPKGKFTGNPGILVNQDLYINRNIGVQGSATHKLKFGTIKYRDYNYPSLTHSNGKVGIVFGASQLYLINDNTIYPMSRLIN